VKRSPAVDGDVSGTREVPRSMKTSRMHRDCQSGRRVIDMKKDVVCLS
jgi:hypothetical protein